MKDKKNLEQQLADKLGNRSIAPSEQAWERIVRNREQNKDRKKKKTAYLYYAASVAVLLIFGGYFFMMDRDDVLVESQVVKNSDAKKEAVDVNAPDIMPETAIQPKQMEIAVSYEIEKNTSSDVHKDEIMPITGPYKEVEPRENLPAVSVAVLHDKKVLTREQLYEQEVDYLLKNAVKDVAADKLLSKPTDNAALLKEVESEMDEYYRDKAMSIFSLRHKKIRIAVRE